MVGVRRNPAPELRTQPMSERGWRTLSESVDWLEGGPLGSVNKPSGLKPASVILGGSGWGVGACEGVLVESDNWRRRCGLSDLFLGGGFRRGAVEVSVQRAESGALRGLSVRKES